MYKFLRFPKGPISSISQRPHVTFRFFTNPPPSFLLEEEAFKVLLKDFKTSLSMVNDFQKQNALDSISREFQNEDLNEWRDEDEDEVIVRRSPEGTFGKKRIGMVVLPQWLDAAVMESIKDYDRDLLRVDALRIYDSLRSTTGFMEAEMAAKNKDPLFGPCKSAARSFKDAASKHPNKPHLLQYGTRESMAYMTGYMPIAYGPIYNVLAELRTRLPDFFPKRILDVGTGPGTALWAANEVWGSNIQLLLGIDNSHPMLQIADALLAMRPKTSPNSEFVFKRYMEYDSNEEKYDLVISSFALNEFGGEGIKSAMINSMWNQTKDILVLVERGTPAGFQAIAKARKKILEESNNQLVMAQQGISLGQTFSQENPVTKAEKDSTSIQGAHVVAPCPHDGQCPILSSRNWCHFSQRIQRPSYLMKTKNAKVNIEDAMYSYVVIRKGTRPGFTASTKSEEGVNVLANRAYHWPRLILPPLKRKEHVVMDCCVKNGVIERFIIPKSQGKIPYNDAKKIMWGDLFPHTPKNKGVQRLGIPDAERQLSTPRSAENPISISKKQRFLQVEDGQDTPLPKHQKMSRSQFNRLTTPQLTHRLPKLKERKSYK
ncbi:hypothetical protein G9A89_014488 [Geosiphon pyriformis]|nr:hypothetical protein G9A89_014488 [Geosiphon pyriformis]